MKTTIDLPDDLVRDLKLRAVRERRKLKEIAAEFLRLGLRAGSEHKTPARARVLKDKKTGLPVIQCRRSPSPDRQPTPDDIARVLIEQEAGWAAATPFGAHRMLGTKRRA